MRFKNWIRAIGLIIPVFVLMQGCNNNWDDHYTTLDETTEKDKIISEMEKIPEISKFTEAVKKVEGLDEYLDQNRLFTVFAPVNEAFETIDESILNNEVLFKRMIDYHFVGGKYKYKDLSAGELTTFNSKHIDISTDGSSNVLIDNKATIVESDYLTLNGMIQVIDKPLIPLNDVYEYFVYNDHTNVFEDAILSYTIREFNEEESEPVGTNNDGEIIYDSVFNTRNPFLYDGSIMGPEYFYNVNFRYMNIDSEVRNFRGVIPVNFESAIALAEESKFLNASISEYDYAGPILTNMIMETNDTKDELIQRIRDEGSDEEEAGLKLYFADLLENNYIGEVPLSNGSVYEVEGFEYDLAWLVTDQGNRKDFMDDGDYRDELRLNMTYSEKVDTIYESSRNIKTTFYYDEEDLEGYNSKYGAWVKFELKGDFYPVDYKVKVRGRNDASGVYVVQVDGQNLGSYNFENAPSGDSDSEFDELGTVSFDVAKSTVNLRFIFSITHSGTNKNEQYLWIREIMLSPILE